MRCGGHGASGWLAGRTTAAAGAAAACSVAGQAVAGRAAARQAMAVWLLSTAEYFGVLRSAVEY
jgi:hypothetical protein